VTENPDLTSTGVISSFPTMTFASGLDELNGTSYRKRQVSKPLDRNVYRPVEFAEKGMTVYGKYPTKSVAVVVGGLFPFGMGRFHVGPPIVVPDMITEYGANVGVGDGLCSATTPGPQI